MLISRGGQLLGDEDGVKINVGSKKKNIFIYLLFCFN